MTGFWITPPGDILKTPSSESEKYNYIAPQSVASVLGFFGCSCKVCEVVVAPQVVSYGIELDDIRKHRKVQSSLSALSAHFKVGKGGVTMTASDKHHFWLTVRRRERATIYFKPFLMSSGFQSFKGHLTALFGVSTENEVFAVDIAKLPHLLIAGATGSGKSVALNSLLSSLLFKHTPSTLRMVMIDTKQTELSFFSGIPHLMSPVITNFKDALFTLSEVCQIMDNRNAEMHRRGVKNILETDFPRILVVIDELADLMIKFKDQVEPFLVRIAQLGRSSGIHLVVCTQRPTVNVITGLIKANIPARIALQCSSVRDSMTILDHKGAEQLTGRGDAILKLPSRVEEIRMQVPFIRDDDIRAVADYWRSDAALVDGDTLEKLNKKED